MSRKYEKRNTRVIEKTSHHPRPTNQGVRMLTQAADLKVQEQCTKIADALAEQAVKGNASSARLLVDLAEGADWVKDPEAVVQVLSLVDSWSKEAKCSERSGQPGEVHAGVLASVNQSAPRPYVN